MNCLQNKVMLVGGLMLVALMAWKSAHAAPTGHEIRLSDSGTAAKTAQSLYHGFLRQDPKARIEAASVELWAGHPQDLIVRFVSSATCTDSGSECHTVVLSMHDGSWRQVMAQTTKTIAIARHPASQPAVLILDGKHVWQFYAGDYLPRIGSYIAGRPMAASTPIKDQHETKILQSYFGSGKAFAMRAVNVGGALGTIDVVQPTGENCGEAGCAIVVFGDHKALLETYSPGLFGIAQPEFTRDGVLGLVVSTIKGLDFYSWDPTKARYRLGRTSYPSKVTPNP